MKLHQPLQFKCPSCDREQMRPHSFIDNAMSTTCPGCGAILEWRKFNEFAQEVCGFDDGFYIASSKKLNENAFVKFSKKEYDYENI